MMTIGMIPGPKKWITKTKAEGSWDHLVIACAITERKVRAPSEVMPVNDRGAQVKAGAYSERHRKYTAGRFLRESLW